MSYSYIFEWKRAELSAEAPNYLEPAADTSQIVQSRGCAYGYMDEEVIKDNYLWYTMIAVSIGWG
jgi:hypothetical protein